MRPTRGIPAVHNRRARDALRTSRTDPAIEPHADSRGRKKRGVMSIDARLRELATKGAEGGLLRPYELEDLCKAFLALDEFTMRTSAETPEALAESWINGNRTWVLDELEKAPRA